MKNDIVISAKGVSKVFCRDLKRSLYYGLKEIVSLRSKTSSERVLRKDEFWAVKDVSFELRRGECLGLIGHNGAGKSTLLKMLNGIITPDEGEIRINGRVAALIELGAGFNPILTGRENIYNNASVLGFSRKEIDEKLEKIITFSEIEEYIDMPVQNYSSGMKVRLGFAVASNLNPDLLLIDEVLAVGDVGFKIKCYAKIAELMKTTTIIFVSHSMPQVSKICSSVLLLDNGEELFKSDDLHRGVELYYSLFEKESSSEYGEGVSVNSLRFGPNKIEGSYELGYQEEFEAELEFTCKYTSPGLRIELIFFDQDMKQVAICQSKFLELEKEKNVKILINAGPSLFTVGTYTLTLAFNLFDENGVLIKKLTQFRNIAQLKSINVPVGSSATFVLPSTWSRSD